VTSGVGQNKFKVFAEMIKFEHTIFALPFAYLGALLAAKGIPSIYDLFWITMAMLGARTTAMGLNRLIDRHIDALNPRTVERAIPKGLISVKETWAFVVISTVLFIFSAAMLNSLSVRLLPIAVFFLVIYSYTKRFTWLAHLVLGIAIGIAPAGAWVGINGSLDLPAVLLWVAVAFWIGGFDVVYSCQDYEFDKSHHLNSIPVRFGIRGALRIAALAHIIPPLLFIIVGYLLNLGWFYYIGVGISSGILFFEHKIVSHKDLSKLNIAFFNMNGILSVIMFVFTLLDVLF